MKKRLLEPGSPGYQYVQTILLLHLPNAQRSFLRIDSVQALQNEKLLREWQNESQGLATRDAWFYPFPGDDVDTVTKSGFATMDKKPMRVGLYFLEQEIPSGSGPVLKMVLCKAAVGKSIYREEGDVEAITRCPSGYNSVYVPSAEDGAQGSPGSPQSISYDGSVFSDTYIMYESKLLIPTHVITYHLEVDPHAAYDNELLSWVNEQCQNTFGFTESNFAHYFINLARTSESSTVLATRLRDQADVPPALADSFARDLYQMVMARADAGSFGGSELPIAQEVDDGQLLEALMLLGLEDQPGQQPGPPVAPGPHVLEEACMRINSCMAEIEALGSGLREVCEESDVAASDFDQQLFERSLVFKAELVTYLKEYMLTMQVAEEREQEMTRAINDSFNLNEFMAQQKNTITKVAMLTQWKNLTSLRNDLKRRLSSLTGLKGASLVWLTPTAFDQEIAQLERQSQQKDRILRILQERLQEVPKSELTEEEQDLLEIL